MIFSCPGAGGRGDRDLRCTRCLPPTGSRAGAASIGLDDLGSRAAHVGLLDHFQSTRVTITFISG